MKLTIVQKSRRSPGKRGRPPLASGEGKRFPLSLRTTKDVRDQLEAAAKRSGRSLAQEVEFRLERSFHEEDALNRDFGGKDRFNLMKWFAVSIGIAERITGKSWETDLETYRIAERALFVMLKSGMSRTTNFSEEDANKLGATVADTLIDLSKRMDEQREQKER